MSANNSNYTTSENQEEILAVVAKCATGEIASIRKFFDIYSEDIYNFPIRVFHLDEDQASEFFLYAFEKLKNGKRFKSYKGISRFRTWFFTVLRNLLIDWMRTLKEVDTVILNPKAGDENSGASIIENMPDLRLGVEKTSQSQEQFSEVLTLLADLPLESRIVFKFSYLYYFNLEIDEVEYVSKASGLKKSELLLQLSELKNNLADKALKSMDSIDKITSLFLNITDLKAKYERLKKEIEQFSLDGTRYSGPDKVELDKIEKLITKKRIQREKIIEKEDRGNFIVRTPHKDISRFLNLPEGSISVQLSRVVEKLK